MTLSTYPPLTAADEPEARRRRRGFTAVSDGLYQDPLTSAGRCYPRVIPDGAFDNTQPNQPWPEFHLQPLIPEREDH